MKKALYTILLLFLLTINVKAYENEYFKIDLTDNYKEDIIEKGTYKWKDDNKYISISLNNNSLKYDVKSYTEEDLLQLKQYLEESLNKGLEEYNIVATVNNIKVVQDYIEYDIYYPSKSLYGYDTYQKGRMYTTNNLITTVIYNSDKEITNEDEDIKIIDSLTIKDTIVKTIDYKKLIPFMIVLGTILGIIGYFRDKNKRKK